MRICKECGTVITTPAYKLSLKIEKANGDASQLSVNLESLESVSDLLLSNTFLHVKKNLERSL